MSKKFKGATQNLGRLVKQQSIIVSFLMGQEVFGSSFTLDQNQHFKIASKALFWSQRQVDLLTKNGKPYTSSFFHLILVIGGGIVKASVLKLSA